MWEPELGFKLIGFCVSVVSHVGRQQGLVVVLLRNRGELRMTCMGISSCTTPAASKGLFKQAVEVEGLGAACP